MTDTEARLSDLPWTRGCTDPDWIRRFASAGREPAPSRRVWRGPGPSRSLSGQPADLGALDLGGTMLTLPGLFPAAHTDAFLVLHRGTVVHEAYPHGTEPHTPHFNASAAKSYVGLLAAVSAHDGLLDRSARTSAHVPELAGTAFGEARIEDLLHMGTQVGYAGRPYDKAREAQRYHAVVASPLRPFGYSGPTTIREHLLTARATGRPGTGFRYENGNVEALAEVLRRVTGLSTSALLSELLWSLTGAEEDAYYILDGDGDGDGVEAACGGFSATARDVVRLGEMLRCGGAVGDRQVVPEEVVRSITGGYPRRVRFPAAPPASPATLSYHDLWWILNDPYDSYMASGIHGQRLFVSPGLDLVVVHSPGLDLVVVHFGSQVVSPAVPVVPLVQAFLRIGTHLAGLG